MTLKIVPPEGGSGDLSVEDAMKQVLDAFALLAGGRPGVTWRLVSASTNSPLTIVAEADDSIEATEQSRSFTESLHELSEGRFPEAWKRPELQVIAASFLRRSSSSTARTEFTFPNGATLELRSEDAAPFAGVGQLVDALGVTGLPTTYGVVSKRQVGSIEGVLIEVTTYRGGPAIRVRERKTNRDVTCVISSALALEFSDHASVEDVWTHRRVTVRGVISYQANGSVLRVEATHIEQALRSERPLPSLRDPTFTNGLTAADYLDKFRAGEIG